MNKNSLPIGVFDSGVGGLTVVREIMSCLPDEEIIYFGDTARVPYGNKSPETVRRYSMQIAEFLMSQKVKAIVIACNTASAFALDTLRAKLDIPVIGVIEPGARAACSVTANHRIGVTGTIGTVGSGLYSRFINDIDSDAEVFGRACPLFVSLVEEGMIDDPVTIQMIHRYMDELADKDVDTIILGCTHYPILHHVINREMNAYAAETGLKHRITLVNPAYETARALKELLREKNMAADKSAAETFNNINRFYVSDGADRLKEFAGSIMHMQIGSVELKVL